MKQQAIQYVALDVHQATLVVSVRDEQGSVVMRATAATAAKAIVGLCAWLYSRMLTGSPKCAATAPRYCSMVAVWPKT